MYQIPIPMPYWVMMTYRSRNREPIVHPAYGGVLTETGTPHFNRDRCYDRGEPVVFSLKSAPIYWI